MTRGILVPWFFQPYLIRLDNVRNPPFYFDDGDDWEIEWRNTNFNFTGLSQGRFNIRLGHFEIPFGLEQNIDTNGTVRQYSYSDREIKSDWGVSLNGVLEHLEYELALSRGSGNKYSSRHDPYLLSARLGTPTTANLVLGLSGFYGEILGGAGTTKHKMLGADLAYYFYQWEFLFELAGGKVENSKTVKFLAEASWRSPMEILHLYTQFRNSHIKLDSDWTSTSRISLGIKYDFNTKTSLSAEIGNDRYPYISGMPRGDFLLQLRIRI